MSDDTETKTGWLSPEGLESVRAEMPIVYVDAIPVRLDGRGEVTHIGLLLRVAADGTISRTFRQSDADWRWDGRFSCSR